jgi:hypothetical protein
MTCTIKYIYPDICFLSVNYLTIFAICIISAIGIVLSVLGVLMTFAALSTLAFWYPIWAIASIVVGAICTYGLWMMKKWALFLYTALFVLQQIIGLAVGAWTFIGLIIPLIVLAICWYYQAKMT